MAKRILVVEDEAPIREMLCFVLEQKGYETIEAEDYADGLAKVREPYPELIVLDWMMPGGSGIQFIKQLKQDEVTRQIPVVMLTARGEEEDKVRGLEAGADDYITKPFSPKELTARLHAVMRRVSPTSVDEVIEVQGLKLDPVSHRVSAEEKSPRPGADRVQIAPLLHDPSRAGLQPGAVAQQCLGYQCVRRGQNRGCAYPSPAQGNRREQGTIN